MRLILLTPSQRMIFVFFFFHLPRSAVWC